MKKFFKVFIIVLLALVLAFGIAAGVFFGTYQATVSFDFAEKTGAVKKGASGYLYGIAENGVPSAEMVESIDVQTIAQKVPGGLQHPVGDMLNADKMLKNAKYEVVYLQDVYDTWYYCHDEIMQQRSDGSYNWEGFLKSDYLPQVEKNVRAMQVQDFSAPMVYCLYNECDNGIWFGETQKDDNPDNAYGVWCDYNDTGKDNFNKAWKMTYDLVRGINSEALIGGPGYCDFDANELEYFLSFCKKNNCLPDVMIYHELGADTAYFFDEHIREYRALEKKLGIEPLEIIITEYGMMNENGYPGEMVKIISQFETNKVYGDNAYWRLADNLNDTCADDNSPNAEWWLMRWYTDMKGETVQATNKDILSSNFKNYFKYRLDALSFRGFTGIASADDKEIDIVCGGGNRKSRVQLKHLNKTTLYGKTVTVTVEETVYKGLYGIVHKPVVRDSFTETLGKSLTVELSKLDAANAYHIVIKEADDSKPVSASAAERYEFENGRLLGDAYTYDSYCPASGGNKENHDTVGGMEKEGDGVELTFETEKGDYLLEFVYGKANDGPFGKNGRQNPDDRISATVKLTLDGESQEITLPNTIKSEYSSCYSVPFMQLEAGKHTVRLEHIDGTYVLDSLLVSRYNPSDFSVAVLPDADRSSDALNSFLAVAPSDGYYMIYADTEELLLDNAVIRFKGGSARAYLKRGLNFLDVVGSGAVTLVAQDTTELQSEAVQSFNPRHISGSGTAKRVVKEEKTVDYIDGITSKGGSAQIKYKAPQAGVYRITIDYANNDEGGVHDYNVDLIERYFTVYVNGAEVGNCYCRNTYSWQTRKTVTFTVTLDEGENFITLANNGSERFNGKKTAAPHLYGVTVAPAQLP